jgi:glycosyltransferase involved in cell wall biosynthesis
MSDLLGCEVNPEGVERAEVIVCIPSYNEADAIAHPTVQADKGLTRYFSDKSAVIINCDNDSPDKTREAFLETPTVTPKIYLSTPPGVLGKGNNFRNLFRKTLDLGAKAVVVVDADLKSITPEWIKHLGEPLFNGFSYVAPLYVRHKYDGTITNNIAYPMTRCLYGRRVRQPIGGDFGFSARLAKTYLEGRAWDESIANFGIDIWMTTLAIGERVNICQSFMGKPKVHRAKDPTAELGPMFSQVVGTILSLMIPFESFWSSVKYSRPTAIYGFGLGEVEMPPRIDVHVEDLLIRFREGFERHDELWHGALSTDVHKKITEIHRMKPLEFDFPTDLWARVLFDVAVAFRDRPSERGLLMDSLMPLYLGRTAAFVRKTRQMSVKQAEEAIEEDCMTFEMAKPYLLQRWQEKR